MNIPLNVPMCDLQMTRDSRGDAPPPKCGGEASHAL
jgi:hypothetical protein